MPCRRISARRLRTISGTRFGRSGAGLPLVVADSQYPDPGPSPLEQVIGHEAFERYEAALATLKPGDREAIVARVELQQSYEEVAIALEKPSANAARVAVARAVKNLVKAMAEDAAKTKATQV